MLVKNKEMLIYIDAKSSRGLGIRISDCYVILCKTKLTLGWMERKKMGRVGKGHTNFFKRKGLWVNL